MKPKKRRGRFRPKFEGYYIDCILHKRRCHKTICKICLWRVSTALEKYGCPLLVTLTFQGDASDASYANDALRDFQVRLRSEFPEAQSLFVPELSPKGRIHFHGLVFNVPLSLGDTRQGEVSERNSQGRCFAPIARKTASVGQRARRFPRPQERHA